MLLQGGGEAAVVGAAPSQRMHAHLQQLLCKSEGDDTCRAAHAAEVVGHDVGAHLEVVDNHGCKHMSRRRAGGKKQLSRRSTGGQHKPVVAARWRWA